MTVGYSTSGIEVLAKLPDYFEEHGFKNPSDAYNGPFQYAMGTDLHFFDWVQTKPKLQQAFNTVMAISRLNKGPDWFDFYPVGDKITVDDPSRVRLVDIGGGLGHDLIAFKDQHPHSSGRLILQDLPSVIDAVGSSAPGIEAMGYDFFTTQPIQGAKAYYLRTVLHDWPDTQARQILRNIRTAMADDSILLINENAIAEEHVPLYSAELDLTMMVHYSSLDRTETQFKELLESAGFNLVGTWKPCPIVPGSGTLFEAMVRH